MKGGSEEAEWTRGRGPGGGEGLRRGSVGSKPGPWRVQSQVGCGQLVTCVRSAVHGHRPL